MKAELAGAHPTPLERLLVDEIVICHLARTHAQVTAADPSIASLAVSAFRLRRAESAQKRWLSAVKPLTNLRALAPGGLAPLNRLRIFAEGA